VLLNMRSAAATGSAREEIVTTALRVFGERGIEPTSLRRVARACDVSPALVVHHFGGKEGLVAAVDEVALREFGDAYASDGPAEGPEWLRRRAAQTARVMREHPAVCAYVGRALVERTPGATRLFRAMIEGGQREVDGLVDAGALRGDADRLWATLQHFFLIWAPLSFMPMLDEVLDGPLLDASNLDRWVSANVALLEKGIYR
jgi:AcrR family transcriptional regulator